VRLIALPRALLLANGFPRSELRMYPLMRGVWNGLQGRVYGNPYHLAGLALFDADHAIANVITLHGDDIAFPLSGVEQQVKCEPHGRRCRGIKPVNDLLRPALGDLFLLV
jgi:hypothetical protein